MLIFSLKINNIIFFFTNIMVKAKDLLKIQKKRETKNRNYIKKVHKKVEKKILLASNTNYYECWCSVPEFIMGMPLYNLSNCINFIVERLEKMVLKFKYLIQIYCTFLERRRRRL